MFTGIIEETGLVSGIKKGKDSQVITIEAKTVLEGTKLGDSIAVNGICLTVVNLTKNSFSADVMHETLNRSSLKGIGSGDRVNLERAMACDGRFGGHIVSGHVDGTGTIKNITKDDIAYIYFIEAPSGILKYIVEKGSITIDGISLTVVDVSDKGFRISIIPHTMGNTILKDKKVGDIVNLENDIISKYVERLLMFDSEGKETASGLSMDMLGKYGFL